MRAFGFPLVLPLFLSLMQASPAAAQAFADSSRVFSRFTHLAPRRPPCRLWQPVRWAGLGVGRRRRDAGANAAIERLRRQRQASLSELRRRERASTLFATTRAMNSYPTCPAIVKVDGSTPIDMKIGLYQEWLEAGGSPIEIPSAAQEEGLSELPAQRTSGGGPKRCSSLSQPRE